MGGSSKPVVVLDNGAGNIKLGFGGEAGPRSIFPNCTAKPKGERAGYVGHMLLDCQEISQLTLRRPFDRGYLVNWDLEREIWSHAFKSVLGLGSKGNSLNISDCGLLLTEPMFNFPQLQSATEQVVFEELGFRALYCAPAPLFSLRRMAGLDLQLPASQAGAGIVVDAGFSFMHAVPFFDWKPLQQGVKRVDVGGKALTNYLKELVSYRCLNMMDEPYLMEIVKENVCFVSKDPRLDLKLASMRSTPHRREFVLPDMVSNFRGYVRDPYQHLAQQQAAAAAQQGDTSAAQQAKNNLPQEQVLLVNNERFMVPEVAFHPSDIGLQQAGIVEAVAQVLQSVPPSLHELLCSNVILTGGLVKCPGFKERFEADLRPLLPNHLALKVREPQDPVTCAWEGMTTFVASGQYHSIAITRAQYEETGGRNRDRWRD